MINGQFTKLACIFACAFLFACNSDKRSNDHSTAGFDFTEYNFKDADNEVYQAHLVELTDKQYPDNPDIFIRSKYDGQFSHSQIVFTPSSPKGYYNISIIPANTSSDTIELDNVKLYEWIPTVPEAIKADDYLTKICLNNQEWNRFQVKFDARQFNISGKNKEFEVIQRVDLANNCLQTGLWEIIAFANEDSVQKPAYHAWFEFPKPLYAKLFQERNKLEFKDYGASMVDFIPAEPQLINLSKLRTVESEATRYFVVQNQHMYPLEGERAKKRFNILLPDTFNSMTDFLTDQTQFATFTPPGIYAKNDPRKTQLSRFSKLISVTQRTITSTINGESGLLELDLTFQRSSDRSLMHYIIGGINPADIPVLDSTQVNNGLQMPMGIANHSFYESYENALERPSLTNPYYALLTDDINYWLDSHDVGIDGPLMYWEDENKTKLHLWILSFERHALIGHYVINLSPTS